MPINFSGTGGMLRMSGGGGGGGAQGPQGSQGPQGDAGAQGFQGNQGTQGSQGFQGDPGAQGTQGVTGMGFVISKVYNSDADRLNAVGGLPADGEFALIAGSLSQSDADYGKLYLYKTSGGWTYQTDMSIQGIQGPQGSQGTQGTQGVQGNSGSSGNAGYSALVSVSSATTLTSSAIGKLHVCSASSAYAVTLPSASSCNGYTIGMQIDSTSTAIVTLTAAGSDTIDGAATRMMWAGEMAQVYSDGSKWIKIAGKSIPMIGGLTSNSTTTLVHATDTKVNLGAVASVSNSPPGMNDTANSKLIVQRAAKYLIFASHRTANAVPPSLPGYNTATAAEIRIFKGNVEWRLNSRYVTSGDSPVIQLNTAAVLTAGDSFYISAKQYSSSNKFILVDENNIFTMVEVPEW